MAGALACAPPTKMRLEPLAINGQTGQSVGMGVRSLAPGRYHVGSRSSCTPGAGILHRPRLLRRNSRGQFSTYRSDDGVRSSGAAVEVIRAAAGPRLDLQCSIGDTSYGECRTYTVRQQTLPMDSSGKRAPQ